LAELLPDKAPSAIKQKARKLGLKKENRSRLTPEQLAELKRDYHNTLSSELSERFGCSLRSIYNAQHRLGLKKDKEFVAETARKNLTEDHPARKHLYKKGQTAFNKGKKQTEFMSPEAIERTRHTRFQTGQLPHNTRRDFDISERFHKKCGKKYKYIRIGLGKWIPYQRYVWERAYGTIPAGYNIQFKDGDTLNCSLDNLYMISRAEQMKGENSFYVRYPEGVRSLIHLKGELKRQINKATKNGNN